MNILITGVAGLVGCNYLICKQSGMASGGIFYNTNLEKVYYV